MLPIQHIQQTALSTIPAPTQRRTTNTSMVKRQNRIRYLKLAQPSGPVLLAIKGLLKLG
jgi:hypothetical protein